VPKEAELRRFESAAASRGISVQTAVHQAMEAWVSSEGTDPVAEPLESLEGSLANVDVFRLLREEMEVEDRKDRVIRMMVLYASTICGRYRCCETRRW
jgi:hypothetical protein